MKIINASVEPMTENIFGYFVADELIISKCDDSDVYMIIYNVRDHMSFDEVVHMNHDIWRAAWRKFRRLHRG